MNCGMKCRGALRSTKDILMVKTAGCDDELKQTQAKSVKQSQLVALHCLSVCDIIT